MSKRQEKFLVPYCFISLPEKKTIVKPSPEEKKYTGKLTCEITTRTPLFIPNTSCSEVFYTEMPDHKSYDFYSYTDLKKGDGEKNIPTPVIPGSEIRGMMRSVYEAVTGSCMSIINDEENIRNRVNPNIAKTFFSPGLLHRTSKGYRLIAADRVLIKKDEAEKYHDGEKLYFAIDYKSDLRRRKVFGQPSKKRDEKHSNGGYLLKGELKEGVNKKYASILCLKEKEYVVYDENLMKTDYLRKKMKQILAAYQEDSKLYMEYAKQYHAFLDGNGEEYFPVCYWKPKTDGNDMILELSPATISKKINTNSIGNLLGDFEACKSTSELCPTCNLFGMVNGSTAKASKLRFADAKIIGTPNFMKKLRLEELASPHISNAQMYLQRPSANAIEWNYDYWLEMKEKDIAVHLYKPKLNGRKFYWHHASLNLVHADEETERNVTVRPLAKGNKFIEEIYFDKITKQQLQQLIYLCNISKDGIYGYKLGMGKPLGLGSIEMRAMQLTLRSFDITSDDIYCENVIDLQNAPSELYVVSYEDAGFCTETPIKEQFLAMMNFEIAKGQTISYPYTKQQMNDEQMKEGFQWYSINNTNKAQYVQSLNTEEWQSGKLPLLRVNEKPQNKKSQSKKPFSNYNKGNKPPYDKQQNNFRGKTR